MVKNENGTLTFARVPKGESMSEEDNTHDNTYEFYKKFYDENRVKLLQYDSLRKHFNDMVTKVLGETYYNMAMDVYECDRICCEDIVNKAKGFWQRFFNK